MTLHLHLGHLLQRKEKTESLLSLKKKKRRVGLVKRKIKKEKGRRRGKNSFDKKTNLQKD